MNEILLTLEKQRHEIVHVKDVHLRDKDSYGADEPEIRQIMSKICRRAGIVKWLAMACGVPFVLFAVGLGMGFVEVLGGPKLPAFPILVIAFAVFFLEIALLFLCMILIFAFKPDFSSCPRCKRRLSKIPKEWPAIDYYCSECDVVWFVGSESGDSTLDSDDGCDD